MVGTISSLGGGGFSASCLAILSFLRAIAAAEWLPGGRRGGDADGTRELEGDGADAAGTADLDLACGPANTCSAHIGCRTCLVSVSVLLNYHET